MEKLGFCIYRTCVNKLLSQYNKNIFGSHIFYLISAENSKNEVLPSVRIRRKIAKLDENSLCTVTKIGVLHLNLCFHISEVSGRCKQIRS